MIKLKILAIIPARGGSKGIINKNIISLVGSPLIKYTIDVAKQVEDLNRILISTDSKKIKDISDKYGKYIPFLRSKKNSKDESLSIDLVLEVLDILKSEFEETYDYVLLLQPTSPLREVDDVLNCIDIINKNPGVSVVSITKIDEPHPFKLKLIKKNRIVDFLKDSDSSLPRQLLPDVYRLNGAIYLAPVNQLYSKKSFFSDNTIPYIMPSEKSVNIDSKLDVILAEYFLNQRNK